MQLKIVLKNPQQELAQTINEIDYQRIQAALSMVDQEKKSGSQHQITLTQTYDLSDSEFQKIKALIKVNEKQEKKKKAKNKVVKIQGQTDEK